LPSRYPNRVRRFALALLLTWRQQQWRIPSRILAYQTCNKLVNIPETGTDNIYWPTRRDA
jgi:hypothetical protein